MKSYHEMADNVLRRMKEYEAKKKRKRIVITVSSCCCIVLLVFVGFLMWRSGIFGTITPPDLENPIIQGENDVTPTPQLDVHIEIEKQHLTFEEVILLSNVCIVGECQEIIWHENYGEVKFRVKECLYGNVADKEIYLFSNKPLGENMYSDGYPVAAEHYEEGNNYILILEKWQSIMYDHDRYMEIGEGYNLNTEILEASEEKQVKDYICSVYDSVSHPEEEVPTVYDSELEEMIGESTFVGVVKILDMENEVKTDNGNVYKVSVESLLKEDEYLNQSSILLKVLKNMVEIGESYIIGFSPVGENSLIHTQTTKTGVYEVTDEILAEVDRILEK